MRNVFKICKNSPSGYFRLLMYIVRTLYNIHVDNLYIVEITSKFKNGFTTRSFGEDEI